MLAETKEYLISLASKYEVSSFCKEDPSQFLYWYSKDKICDVECASFIASMLSFGSRTQFIPKIKSILELAEKENGCISRWILNGSKNFPSGQKKFYRFYSYDDMRIFFGEISSILEKEKSMGEYFRKKIESDKKYENSLHQVIYETFPESKIVPKGKNSANKRIFMFLRWMVRQNSPVDLGIWDWYSQKNLLIPLDVHVMQESIKLGLIPEKATASFKTAKLLTEQLKEIWPEDPCRGDFALFGYGVGSKKINLKVDI